MNHEAATRRSSASIIPAMMIESRNAMRASSMLAIDMTRSANFPVSGTFAFTVQVTDSLGDTASRGYSLTVTGNLVITTQPPLAEGTVGKPYSVSFGASGGRQPYTWSVTGSTPPGLAFNNGDLTGTPTSAGTFSSPRSLSRNGM